MHKNKKAWFSQSVSRHICDLWVTEGGIITNWCSADFLFSNDAAHPDTQRIFESLDFVEDKATVFHASYLSACEESGLKDSVAMGHFLLPPSCLHEEIRAAVGNFIWELDNPLQPQQTYPVNNMVTGFISIDELKKYSGDLYDFIPGSTGYSVCRAQREKMFSVLKSRNRNHTFIHTN
ncbi:telomere repeats-binding bouquet formation protein 2 [Stegostoma tigrinum]|uniref:telomere repeats-binding bouquet formation protein 2 n=1 Tax=Stegostoma tigrinum TaxID=3053191 RepID=UPI0028709F28|nr:telomere repeats-binding bouquet formation protein 2 [Stegostoma tigrinum]